MLSPLFSPLQQTLSSHPILAALASSTLLLLLTIYFSTPPRRFPIHAPTLPASPREQRKRWRWNTDGMLREAYRKFPGQVFQVWTSEGPEIMLPPGFVDEVKGLPDAVLSATEGMAELLQSRHTTIPIEENHFGIHFTKTILTKNLGKVLPGMIEELVFVFPRYFGSYPDWTPIEPHPRFTPLISSLTARAFVGPTLCRLPSWLQTTEAYSQDVFIAASILKLLPSFSRSVLKNLIPQIWNIRRHNRAAAQIVEAALRDKLGPREMAGERGFEESRDATHGIWELLPEDLKRDYDFQGRGQLGLAAAAIHTTSRLLTHTVYSLAQYPEYAPVLREEIQDVKRQMGEGAEWTVETLGRLRKLDSFVKETLRLYAGGVTSFRRKVLAPVTLSNTLVLPPGSYISAPLCAIATDPDIYRAAPQFNGLRFHRAVSGTGPDGGTDPGPGPAPPNPNPRPQLTSTSSTSLAFGIGRHACPGRFFAAVEVKIVLVRLLERFEFTLEAGEGRPRDVVFNALRIVERGGGVLVRDLEG